MTRRSAGVLRTTQFRTTTSCFFLILCPVITSFYYSLNSLLKPSVQVPFIPSFLLSSPLFSYHRQTHTTSSSTSYTPSHRCTTLTLAFHNVADRATQLRPVRHSPVHQQLGHPTSGATAVPVPASHPFRALPCPACVQRTTQPIAGVLAADRADSDDGARAAVIAPL